MRRNILLSTTVLLILILMLSSCAAASEAPLATTTTQSTPPSTTQAEFPTTQPPTEPPTSVPDTQPPTTLPATEPPSEPQATVSAEVLNEYIGTLYTRGYLESLDSQRRGFGPGRYYTDLRPPNPVSYQAEYGKYDAYFIGEDTPTVYLTFDCGYEYENLTAKILDVLKERNIKATFFVTMHYCKSQPQLVQRMIDEGHIVGNHSNTHPNMPTISIDSMVYEITSLHEYVKTNFGYEMTFFRPPSGNYSPQVLAVAQTLGYKTLFWSFAYRDWETNNQPDSEEGFYTISSCAHNGCIYLLHTVSSTNATILNNVIDDLLNRGYSIEQFR